MPLSLESRALLIEALSQRKDELTEQYTKDIEQIDKLIKHYESPPVE